MWLEENYPFMKRVSTPSTVEPPNSEQFWLIQFVVVVFVEVKAVTSSGIKCVPK